MVLQMPEERGAWAILLVPFFCAAAVAGRWNMPLLLSGVFALSLFLLRGSLEGQRGSARWRALVAPSHVLLLVISAGAGAWLIFFHRRGQLLWFAAVAAVLFFIQRRLVQAHRQQRTEKRSLAAELAGVGLLTLTAPVAWVAARGSLFDPPPTTGGGVAPGVEIWLLNLLFFLGSILYVKYRVRGVLVHRSFRDVGERLAFAWPVILYHFLLVASLAGWVVLGSPSTVSQPWTLRSAALGLAFAPGVLRANRLLFELGRRFAIPRLGWSEIVHAAFFGTFLILAFRLAG